MSEQSDRFLLPYEYAHIRVRRHWMILLPPILKALAVITVAVFLLSRNPYSRPVDTVATVLIVAALAYLGWQVLQWRMDHFIVTSHRVLLANGVLTKRTAVMPLSKVTDMTYEQTPMGRMLRYGTFIFESAGQDQALSKVSYLPGGARQLYLQISDLLFGPYRRSGSGTPPGTTSESDYPTAHRPHQTQPLPLLERAPGDRGPGSADPGS